MRLARHTVPIGLLAALVTALTYVMTSLAMGGEVEVAILWPLAGLVFLLPAFFAGFNA